MPGTVGNVVRAAPQDVGLLSAALARAFDDDPLSLYLFGGPRTRAAGLARFFAIQLRHTYLRHGEVWTTADRAGAALWAPPTMPRPGGMDLLRILPVLPYLSIWGRKTPDVVRLLAAYERARPRQAHWYLGTLGTDPDRQGQGVGSALLPRRARPSRSRRHPRLPGVVQGEESGLLLPPRLPGDGGDHHPTRSHPVAHVARPAPAGSVNGTRSTSRCSPAPTP